MTKRVAILDLYNNEPNEGMRCIKEIISNFGAQNQTQLSFEVFGVRHLNQIPDLGFDIYIGTGGPGSPLDSAGSAWEENYFGLMNGILHHNAQNPDAPKHVFLICHAFQIFCRYYELGKVSQRKSTSFGVMPIHKTDAGELESFFEGLNEPFWAVDSRDWQVTQPNMGNIMRMNGSVLAIEKYRPTVNLERAMMAMRFGEAIFGTQFHPEADPVGMLQYLRRADKKAMVIKNHGEEKYDEMVDKLDDNDKIVLTHHTILPNFLHSAVNALALA